MTPGGPADGADAKQRQDADPVAPGARVAAAGGTRERVASAIVAALFLGVVMLAYRPGVSGFWMRDDFFVLAYMRLVDAPWAFFFHDHFPVPGSIFRPLGFASMWLTQALFGTQYRAESLVDLGLHVAVAVALYRVVGLAVRPPILAASCALLFAVQPAAMAAVLVWTNRFDLLATLFCLLALRAAYDYRSGGRPIHLAATLIFALGGMAAKELGLAVVAPVFLLWLAAALCEPSSVRWRYALLALLATTVAYFVWRGLVLGTFGSHLPGDSPLPALIARGVGIWLDDAPGYLSFAPRLGSWQRLGLALAALIFVIVSALAARRLRAALWGNRRGELLLSALALWLAAALLQAPVAALNAAPLTADVSAVEVAMQSRLYYLGAIAVTIVVAVMLGAAWEMPLAKPSWPRGAAVVALVAGIAVFATAARSTTRDYGLRSRETGRLAQAVVAAVAERTFAERSCHVYFLDFQPPPEWGVYVSTDAIVKALHPDLARIRDCLFHNEYPTYFYLVPHGHLDALRAYPFRPLERNGRVVPWLTVDGMDIVYLTPPQRVDRDSAGGALFLAYDDGRFRDVTAEVASGRREVRLR